MGLYGVEEQFWVGDSHVEVSFSNESAVGLCQRDGSVGRRGTEEDLTLTDFTGLQLLEAYRGKDADVRKQAFTRQREQLRASYKEARGAPHANGTRLLRHEKNDLKRLEKALAQELCTLPRCQFDLSRVQGQVQSTSDDHLLRSFYFDEVNDRYMHNFCHKYATDPAYRAAVENGTAPWIERNALFLKNLESRAFRETVGQLPPNDREEAVLEALFEEQFFLWICHHAKSILADLAYQRLKRLEEISGSACRGDQVDPGLCEAIAAWNALPGVVVSRSCQGGGGVFSYAGRTLLVPSAHDECANMVVALYDDTVIEALEHCVPAFPLICSTPFYQRGNAQQCQLRSCAAVSNAQVRQDLLAVACEVKKQWLR